MCGIVAMIVKKSSGFWQTDLDTFKKLLIVDSFRGEDATGAFGILSNKQAKIIKVAAEPHMLFRCTDWKEFETKAIKSMSILVGHNRFATKGTISSENAHPFAEGNIVLVHNGTINNQKEMNSDVEVDSHAITHALNEKSAEEVLKTIDGAFALVWYNREDGVLNIARNNERPLHYIEDSDIIYIASEKEMLEFVINRKSSNSYMEPTKLKALPFPTNTLIQFDLKGIRTDKPIEYRKPNPTVYTNQYKTNTTTSKWYDTDVYANTGYYENLENPNVFHRTTNIIPLDINTNIKNDDPDVGKPIIIKLTRIVEQNHKHQFKVTGKTLFPTPNTDIIAYLPANISQIEVNALLKEPFLEANVLSKAKESLCGPSWWVNKIEMPEMINLYNQKIPKLFWNFICATHTCEKCNKPIKTEHADYTSLKQRGKTNNFRVICTDCVIDSVDRVMTGETESVKNIKNSTTTIQTSVELGENVTKFVKPETEQASLLH